MHFRIVAQLGVGVHASNHAVNGRENHRIERDGEERTSQNEVEALFFHQTVGDAEPGEDEGEFADLSQRGGDGERVF